MTCKYFLCVAKYQFSAHQILYFFLPQMQNERIKTEEHIEYDSDDSSESGSSSSSSKSSHNKLEPEVYKTRKDENFTEYFKIHKNQVGLQQRIINFQCEFFLGLAPHDAPAPYHNSQKAVKSTIHVLQPPCDIQPLFFVRNPSKSRINSVCPETSVFLSEAPL